MPKCVTIQPSDVSLRKYATNLSFNTLGAITNRTQPGHTAQRAEIRQSICLTTVAASQPAGFTIVGKRHEAGITPRNPATVSTNQGPSIPFPVEKEQDFCMVM